ncbi:hypothetical protein [Cupriavidus sp. TMH.W2]|uniref:hypothetical protein n=1 Tax=Cupriavidus sp. TMH.W2 TaxID=3434465 RepID=UPI003D777B50
MKKSMCLAFAVALCAASVAPLAGAAEWSSVSPAAKPGHREVAAHPKQPGNGAGKLSPECQRFFAAHPDGKVHSLTGYEDDRYGGNEGADSANFNLMIACNAQRNARRG